MGVTFLSIILGVAIGLVYYFVFKKDEISNNQEEEQKGERAQDFAVKVKNNMLISNSGYSCVIVVDQINYYLYSSSEKDMIEKNFGSMLNSLNQSTQFHIQMHYIDLSRIVQNKWAKVEQLPEELQPYAQKLLNSLDMWGKEKSIMIRTPLIVITSKARSLKEARKELGHQQRIVQELLRRCGLDNRALEEQELSAILYSTLNKERAPISPLPLEITLAIRGKLHAKIQNIEEEEE